MHPVKSALFQLEIGSPQSYGGLTIVPLKSVITGSIDYLLLGEAIGAGLVSVHETSHGGSVPALVVENRADRPVLIVDGEELVGAKQNRVANLTLLVAADKRTVIPVSCVEAGRWSYSSDEFNLSERVHFARGRRDKLASVQYSMGATGDRRSDQGAVWDSIALKAESMDAPSPTGAMGTIFEKHADSLEEFVERFQAASAQTGAVFFLAGDVCGLDLFDKPRTFASLFPKLVRSYAIDALECQSNDVADAKEHKSQCDKRAGDFLALLREGALQEQSAVGLGRDFRIEAPKVVAGGLVVDADMIHLAAFAAPDESLGTGHDAGGPAPHRQRLRSAMRRY